MKYVLGDLIGKGSDGEVYNLLENNTGKKRTIKFIQPNHNYGFENYIEAYILLNLKHDNLMFAYEIEIDENGLIKIVQDKAMCDLSKILYGKKTKSKNKYMKQLVSGINFLHSYNIVHGDIKPSNLLIDINNNLRINDFSFSRLTKYNNDFKDRTNRKLYTYIYRPPECNLNKYSLKSDIYALGCTLYEIYYNQPYFFVNADNRLYHIHAQNYYDLQNNEFNELIKNMINDIPEERYDIEQVCKFFNIDILKKKTINFTLNEKVFINKILHTTGKIKMSMEEKKKEIELFEQGLKIFNI